MKIICIGRNYVEHARELNNPLPESPVFFMKPDTSLVIRNRPFFYPEFSKDIHYETELVVKIKKNGKHIEEKFAHTYYDEIGLGIDFTARDVQAKCKEKGLPWEIAKAFDHSAPISKFISLETLNNRHDIRFHLELNGKRVQEGSSTLMIFSIDHIISYLSRFVTLKMGDLIFTGTPAGVGAVEINDHLVGYIEDYKMLDFRVK
jgi:2-keto-4-pentenoate hydratase/2-oxohepta-3-ene-1,7-dioic acid hydratase in catechol pathway